MPRYSIITCVKNSSLTINETIDSLNNQNYYDYEHIFIDAGSTDKSLDICSRSHNAKIFIEPRLTLYEALNFGIRKSTGDLIFFLHSDDQIIDNNLLKNVSEIFKNKNISFVYSDIIMKKNNKFIRKWKSKNLFKNDIDHFVFPAHTSILYKKEVFNKIGQFNTNYKIASDFDYLARLFNSNLDWYYYNQTTISMNYGGISTKSITNILFQNYENYKIIKKYDNNLLKITQIFIKKIINRLNQFRNL